MRRLHRFIGGLAATLALSFPASAQVLAIPTGQVSVGTSATPIVAARPGRASVDVTVDSAVKCYLGPAGVVGQVLAIPAS